MKKGGKTTKSSKENSDKLEKFILPVKVKKTTKNKTKTVRKRVVLDQKTETEKITPQEKEIVAQILSKKEEDYKIKIMYAGVSFFMIVIIFFWAYNVKNMVTKSNILGESENYSEKLDNISDDFKEKITEIKNNLEEIESFIDTTETTSSDETLLATSTSDTMENYHPKQNEATTSSSTESNIDQENIEELKEKIRELENKLEN